MRRVTIQDIADELGMSRNTVSKAINNADGLADATRRKILEKVSYFDSSSLAGCIIVNAFKRTVFIYYFRACLTVIHSTSPP